MTANTVLVVILLEPLDHYIHGGRTTIGRPWPLRMVNEADIQLTDALYPESHRCRDGPGLRSGVLKWKCCNFRAGQLRSLWEMHQGRPPAPLVQALLVRSTHSWLHQKVQSSLS